MLPEILIKDKRTYICFYIFIKIVTMKKNLFVLLLLAASCTIAPRVTVSNVGNNANSNVVIDGKIYATAYQQRAAEYRALCFQAYNIAHERVDEITLTKTEKPKVIITDIDETVLDNSAYEAHQTLQGKDYESNAWYEWTSMVKCRYSAGSTFFFKICFIKRN